MSAQPAALLKSQAAPALRTIAATLAFTERPAGTAYAYAYDPPEGEPRANIVPDERLVRIADARPIANELSLDVQGFAPLRRPSVVCDFWDEAQTLALGHPEAADIVQAATGAARVVVFDHTLRKRVPGAQDWSADAPRQPAGRVHLDQTVRSGRSGCATSWAKPPTTC